MKKSALHPPVILLLERNNDFAKHWFRKSRYYACEAADIFQALEELADFTVRCRPDVVLLEVDSLSDGFLVVKKMTQNHAGSCEFPIFALSDSGKTVNCKECFEGNLAQIQAKLEKTVPHRTRAHAA